MSQNALSVCYEDANHTATLIGRVSLRNGSVAFESNHSVLNKSSGWNPADVVEEGKRLTSLIVDSLPDLWGRKVASELLKARARKDEVRPAPVDDAQLLRLVCDSDRMGALRFVDEKMPGRYLGERRFTPPTTVDLAELCQTARRIETGDMLSSACLEQFAENATALGGSRPKTSFINEQSQLCIAKFPSINDDRDKGAWEYVTARLAQQAGIRLPDFELIDIDDPFGRVFASKRFDRTEAGSRLHFLSVRALLGATDNRDPRSYRDLTSLIETICHDPEKQKEELWRRTIFKCLIHDGDDHLRNLGFLFTPAGWELAPAFDLNPSLSKTHLTLTYGDGYRDITPEALLKHSSDWGIPSDIAENITHETVQIIARWKDEAQSAGISEAQIKMMQPAFTEHFDCI